MKSESTLRLFRRLARFAVALCFIVVVLGAWVRLTDAGLGCPDWPGCYGQLVVPDDPAAAVAYPDRPLETGKAWREMIHRYAASLLGLMIFLLAFLAWRNRVDPRQPVALPLLLAGLVVFQGLLGMWTVTLLLKPTIVMLHLLGGLTTLALLFWLARPAPAGPEQPELRKFAALGLVILALQLALGGWVSTNYAALACPDLPTCQQQWWPAMDFRTGFKPWHGLGIDYEGGILDHPSRVAIHVTHRIGALVTTLVLGLLVWRAWREPGLDRAAGYVAVALVAQLAIGVSIVLTQLPLALAVAHNAVAALLLLSVVNLNRQARPARFGVGPARPIVR
jgi:cytochrome c oxidase assembly protein subunit 15